MDNKPETYTLDIVGANGTPFRFVYFPNDGRVRYYDRRHPITPNAPGYAVDNANEDGQACGPALGLSTFTNHGNTGMRGWHSVDAWDVDRATMVTVGDWLEMLMERDPR